MLTKQQRDRNDETKEPNPRTRNQRKDQTKPHAATEDRTKNTICTRRYHVTSGPGRPLFEWGAVVPLVRERTHVRTNSTLNGNDGNADSTTSRGKIRSYNEGLRRRDFTKNTHDCHDGKTMTRRTRQARIQTDTSFKSELSDNTADSTYTTTALDEHTIRTNNNKHNLTDLRWSHAILMTRWIRRTLSPDIRNLTSTTITQHA